MIKQYFDTLDANNYTILPCNGKVPVISNWTTAKNDEEWKELHPHKNIGILISDKLLAIDVDITDEECAIAIGGSIIRKFGKNLPTRVGMTPKHLFLFKCADGQIITKIVVHLKSPTNEKHIIEILGYGQQFIGFGKHPSGNNYEWISKRNPLNTPLHELCKLSFSDIADWIADLKSELPNGWSLSKITGLNQQQSNDNKKPSSSNNAISNHMKQVNVSSSNHTNISIEQLKSYLDDIHDYDDYNDWINIGMCLHNYDTVNGLSLWKEWSSRSTSYNIGDCETKWSTFENQIANPLTIASIIKRSNEVRKLQISNKINNCSDSDTLLDILEKAKNDETIKIDSYAHLLDSVKDKYQSLTNRKLSTKELNSYFKNEYELSENGVYYHQEKNGHQISTRICGYLSVEAMTHNNCNRNFGRYLKFKNTRGDMNKCYIPMATLIDKGGAAHRMLVDNGLFIDNNSFNHVINYINTRENLPTVEITNKVGWYNNSYVLPHQTLGVQEVFYQNEGFNASNPYSISGSLEDWQQNISRYCIANPLLMFSVCVGFSGALLKLCGHPMGIGFHIYGGSSQGKSTIAHVSSSVFGNHSNFMNNWRATSNGLESVAELHNDSVLVLDEISQVNGKELAEVIYMLMNGNGRSRATKTGDARETKKWQICVLSNGEKSIETHAMGYGEKGINAGQFLRLLNIPLFGKHGAFNHLHDMESGESLTSHLSSFSQKYFGIAGTTWIEVLISSQENYPKLLNFIVDEMKYEVAKHNIVLTRQDRRALNSFGIVALAGELATDYGVTGWKTRQAFMSAVECFIQWKLNNGFQNTDIETTQVLQAVKNFIDMHSNSRFLDVLDNPDRYITNLAGYKKSANHQIQYMFNDAAFIEALKGYDLRCAISILKKEKWLLHDSNRNKKSHQIHGRTNKLYTILIPNDNADNEYVKDVSNLDSTTNFGDWT
jgi:putative DNA primase/helicase